MQHLSIHVIQNLFAQWVMTNTVYLEPVQIYFDIRIPLMQMNAVEDVHIIHPHSSCSSPIMLRGLPGVQMTNCYVL